MQNRWCFLALDIQSISAKNLFYRMLNRLSLKVLYIVSPTHEAVLRGYFPHKHPGNREESYPSITSPWLESKAFGL